MKFIYPDMATIPEGTQRITTHVAVEEPLAAAWLQEIGNTPWNIVVEDCGEFGFDCGGICYGDEPIMECHIDDWKLTVRVRHAETLQGLCNNVQQHLTTLGDHVWIPGYWVKAILTVETGHRIGQWLAVELPRRIAEADQWWAKHDETMKSAGVYVPPRVR